jgi:hypothetical protein
MKRVGEFATDPPSHWNSKRRHTGLYGSKARRPSRVYLQRSNEREPARSLPFEAQARG